MSLPQRQSDTVVICGFADSRRILPVDLDAEFWGMNALHRADDVPTPSQGWTRWFQLHDIERAHAEGDDRDSHLGWLRQQSMPVYMRPQDIGVWDIPAAVPFPIGEIVSAFPRYFNNTVSYLLALAIAMEFDTLHLVGVDMAQDGVLQGEYQHQRPSCEFFLGLAAGRGMNVNIPEGSDLLKAGWLYGFEDGDAFTAKMLARREEVAHRKEALKQRAAQLKAEHEQLNAGINQLDGALQDAEFVLRTYAPQPQAG